MQKQKQKLLKTKQALQKGGGEQDVNGGVENESMDGSVAEVSETTFFCSLYVSIGSLIKDDERDDLFYPLMS